jgi:exosortase O
MLTAQGVSVLLTHLGVPSVSGEAILQLQSGFADIELACSGVRSLWVGALLFFALSVWRRSREDGRWALCGILFLLALLTGNFLRVFLIVLVACVLGQPALADVLHAPVGHLFFALPTLGLLAIKPRAPVARAARAGSLTLASALLLVFFPAQTEGKAITVASIDLPYERIALTSQEEGLFARHDASAVKYRFAGGTFIIVISSSFRAHHAPEICMAAQGHTVELVAPGQYTIDRAQTGVYWFQSPTQRTTTLLGRALADLTTHEPWALVSVVFDTAEPDQTLLGELSTATSVALEQPRAKSSR